MGPDIYSSIHPSPKDDLVTLKPLEIHGTTESFVAVKIMVRESKQVPIEANLATTFFFFWKCFLEKR
jgi:hypothetical protein